MRSHCIVRSHFQWRNQTFKNAENASYMAHKLLISTYLSIKDTLNNCTMFVTLFHRIFACVRSERCGVVKHPQLPQSLKLYILSSSRVCCKCQFAPQPVGALSAQPPPIPNQAGLSTLSTSSTRPIRL